MVMACNTLEHLVYKSLLPRYKFSYRLHLAEPTIPFFFVEAEPPIQGAVPHHDINTSFRKQIACARVGIIPMQFHG
jgi:hypothetical protein